MDRDKNTRNIAYKRAKRSALSQYVTTRLLETYMAVCKDKNKQQQKNPQKKHRL